MSLRRNVVANYLGQGWVAVMGLAFVPLYIRYLGMEAYGLIGVFSVMQAWLALLDMGMTPTLGREMARFTAGAHSEQSIRNLLRSLEVVCLAIAIMMGIGVWAASGWLAGDWLKAEKLPTVVVRGAIGVMAVVLGLRFVEGLYRSALFGLQRQVWYSAVNAALATLRSVGALVLLATVSPTVEAFFLWQAFISSLSIVVLAIGVYRALPRAPRRASFSLVSLLSIWRFAGGMIGITFMAILLTQVDKVLLSRLLSLDVFGYYMLAASVAGSLYLVITPVTSAFSPRLVELVSRGDSYLLASTYHRGAQLVTTLTAPVALLLAFFGEGVLFAWSGDAVLAVRAGRVLSALSLGTFLNGLMYMPYQLQLAHGWTSLTLKVNSVAVLTLVPAIFWVVPEYGALGAAWVWIALNTGYVLVGIHLMHRRLLRAADKWHWYLRDVGLPTVGATVGLLLVFALKPAGLSDRVAWLVFLSTGFVAALAPTALTFRGVRVRMFKAIGRLIPT